MNTVTPEQLAAAHKADLEAWQAFYDYDMARRDEKYEALKLAWEKANCRSHDLQNLFNAQKLLSEQPQP